ncbi:MAG: molybdenum cofactor biosynthesis protein MoaE [Pseudanabaena sp. ELA607]|jgi:molybdopterin synthase catalytic subunit
MSTSWSASASSVDAASVTLDASDANGLKNDLPDRELLESVFLGTNFCLTVNPLDLGRAYQGAEDAGNGAVVAMTGVVRNQTNGRKVSHLDYQAYDAMVLRCWQNLANRCQEKYPTIRQVVIHHRLGAVAVGELSVVVAVGSPHRAEAFAACQFLIDHLKQEAPIWKKEYWLDGSSSWVSPQF